jgi:hypothetical protein
MALADRIHRGGTKNCHSKLVTGRYALGALDDAIADLSGDSVKVMLVTDDA